MRLKLFLRMNCYIRDFLFVRWCITKLNLNFPLQQDVIISYLHLNLMYENQNLKNSNIPNWVFALNNSCLRYINLQWNFLLFSPIPTVMLLIFQHLVDQHSKRRACGDTLLIIPLTWIPWPATKEYCAFCKFVWCARNL
jgi:hypothetical protein